MARLLINFHYALVALLILVDQIQSKVTNETDAVTITWHNGVAPEKVNISSEDKHPHPARHLAEQSKLYKKIKGNLILEGTNFTSEFPDSISWTKSAGLVDTVFYSYQQHHNLIIRPDDIWTAIIVQFSLYANANDEALRHSFVNFTGKKELTVKFVARIDQVPVNEFIKQILTLINENIDPSIYNWISPNFSTTTENDKLTAGVALMATLQDYFDYNMMLVLCGIPEVTILGTVDDWKEIRDRVKKLNDFELEGKSVMAQWSSMLDGILEQFVSVKEGNKPDDEFWKEAIRVDYKTIDMVCAHVEERYLNGWITAFSAFDELGRWQEDYGKITNTTNSSVPNTPWLRIRTDKITLGHVQVPIKIYDEYAMPEEREYAGAIIAGHMGYSVRKDEKTLQPLSGWAMAITKHLPQYLNEKVN